MITIKGKIFEEEEVINRYCNILNILKRINYYKYFREYNNTILCPFHDDHRPSAKVFFDKTGHRIYCFFCNKQYKIYDIVKQYKLNQKEIIEKEILPYINKIDLSGIKSKKNFKDNYETIKKLSLKELEFLKNFKAKKINIKYVLNKIHKIKR